MSDPRKPRPDDPGDHDQGQGNDDDWIPPGQEKPRLDNELPGDDDEDDDDQA